MTAARTKMAKRTPLQDAVVGLRKAIGGLTQKELAVKMGKAVATVARWEISRPPSGLALCELEYLARLHGLEDLARSFLSAREAESAVHGLPPFEIGLPRGERIYSCPNCGRTFRSSHHRVKYCSTKCRRTTLQREWRARKGR